MTKDEVLKYIELKGDSKFIIRTEEEDLSFLNNYGQGIKEKTETETVTKIHNNYDNDIYEVTGMKRDPKLYPKTFDFNKKLLSEYKTKAEKASEFERDIADLKKQIADGTGDKKTLADLEAVQKAYQELEDTKTKEVNDLRTQFEKYKDESEIVNATTGLQFKKSIPEAAIKSLLKQTIGDLTSIASRQDGKLVFLKDDVPMRNAHNALNPYTVDELLKERLKDVLETGRQAKGGPGISNEITKEYDKGKLSKVSMLIPDSVKTKEDLSKFLVSQKLLRGSEEYTLAYKEYSETLPW